jgi:hypothetical protein
MHLVSVQKQKRWLLKKRAEIDLPELEELKAKILPVLQQNAQYVSIEPLESMKL